MRTGPSGDGTPSRNGPEGKTFDSVERFRVKSVTGQNIVVRFQFDHAPREDEIEDVSGCLARIFEQAKIRREWIQTDGAPLAAIPELADLIPVEAAKPAKTVLGRKDN